MKKSYCKANQNVFRRHHSQTVLRPRAPRADEEERAHTKKEREIERQEAQLTLLLDEVKAKQRIAKAFNHNNKQGELPIQFYEDVEPLREQEAVAPAPVASISVSDGEDHKTDIFESRIAYCEVKKYSKSCSCHIVPLLFPLSYVKSF